jgi:type VII secretion protein EccB
MASRKDQLQSHQFSAQRMVSALVTRESDPERPPFKRPTNSAVWSVVIAVLALAVVGVYGLVVPGGSKAWSGGDAVIVEKETGTRYVYVAGHLHPVANYTSALLALGKYGETRRVSRKSLRGVPRGPRIGIPDAPDALPSKDRLLTGGWTQCSQPALDPSGARTSESVLMIGQQPSAGQPTGERAMLVEVMETGDRYLISKGYRHQIEKSDHDRRRGAARRGADRADQAGRDRPAVQGDRRPATNADRPTVRGEDVQRWRAVLPGRQGPADPDLGTPVRHPDGVQANGCRVRR